MSKLPEIRIYFADLLQMGESQKLATGEKMATYEQYEEWTAAYRKEWKKHEAKILPAMQNVLGLEFHHNTLDVACAPFFIPKSWPLIIGFTREPDFFVDTVTHELAHVLLTDNNIMSILDPNRSRDLVKPWEKMFGDNHDFTCLVHIPVHAMLKYIYLDILKEPKRLKRDIKWSQKHPPYAAAWKYVEDNDYKKILADLKKSYGGMAR